MKTKNFEFESSFLHEQALQENSLAMGWGGVWGSAAQSDTAYLVRLGSVTSSTVCVTRVQLVVGTKAHLHSAPLM